MLTFLVTSIGFLGLLALYPRPVITVVDPVDPSNVLSTSFIISNNGFIPLRHIKPYIGLGQIIYQNEEGGGKVVVQGSDPAFFPEKTRVGLAEWMDKYLGMDDKMTISLSEYFPTKVAVNINKVAYGDITITVEYQPWFLPFTRHKTERFTTMRQTNGNLYFFAKPITESK